MGFMGNRVHFTGNWVGFSGNRLGFTSNRVGFTGNRVGFTGIRMGFMGNWVDFTDNRVDLPDNSVASRIIGWGLMGNRVLLTVLTGNRVGLNGIRVVLTGNRVASRPNDKGGPSAQFGTSSGGFKSPEKVITLYNREESLPPSTFRIKRVADIQRARMATILAASTFATFRCPLSTGSWPQKLNFGVLGMQKFQSFFFMTSKWDHRKSLICAVKKEAEESFKKTVEVDRLIDTLRDANPNELQKLVVENFLAFNEDFWIRLATRTDTCKSEDDKKDYEELASSVMSIVDHLVHKTHEKIESSTEVLKEILKPVIDEVEEISWPPKDPQSLVMLEKELEQRENDGQLDEGFLSEVSAQLRQAKEDRDKPGLEAMLQKVLQLYAAKTLSKRSYAYKGSEVLKSEHFLESLIKAPEDQWNKLLMDGLSVGGGEVSPEEFYAVVKKRIERTLIRTEGGSYQQRILIEYLRGIQTRAEEIVQALGGPQD
ncbi:hypothetical protein H6P81_017626 [Aristolochia fimbriata]|uniref:Uncharacterized protein n=1 Tax=Aristolochia fimbriata TaxID=158543 RepID=A0AAV7DZ74_ARIFI|nr:hypothetical protein H6P81_017626 [Aristolochia fimbriata]